MNKRCIFESSDKQLDFQIATANKLVDALSKKRNLKIRGAVLGDGVGMGKTYTGLFTAFSLMSGHLKKSQLNKRKHTSLLIIVPNDIIWEKWRSEIEPYAKPSNFSDYVKTLKKSKSRIKDKLLAMIQSIKTFEDLKKGSREVSWSVILLKRNQLKLIDKKSMAVLRNVAGFIIYDEAHHLKEPSIIEAFENYVCDLLLHKHAPKFLFLTATPFQKSIDQMRDMFEKHYFLDKEKIYKDLSAYINGVQSYLQEHSNHIKREEELKKLSKSKKPIEKELGTFFVINRKDVFKKNKIKRVEYINGGIIRNDGNFDNKIKRNIQKSISIFQNPKLTKLRERLNDFQSKYLVYRFSQKSRVRIENDLTRFTSFVTSKHRRKIHNLYPLKLDILKHIIKNHFKPYPIAWNQKFIVFCDMVNDDATKGDGRLHKQLKKAISECIALNPSRIVNPPDLARILKFTVMDTVFEDIFFTTKGDKRLRRWWGRHIRELQQKFKKKSKLYHFYGEDIKRYYECRFEQTIRQYACIEFLKRKICCDSSYVYESAKGRKKYFNSLFGKGRINRKFADIPYTRDVLEEMWDLYYTREKKRGWKPKTRIRKVVEQFKAILSEEADLIWQQWEDELPGSSLVEVYSGSKKNSNVLRYFQSPIEPLALVISRVGEEGIDLQAFTRGIIHYDFDWSPGKMVQREGRVDRIGRATDMRGKFRIFKKMMLKKHLRNEDLQVHYIIMPRTYDERKYYRMKERQYLFNLFVPANLENEAFHLSEKLNVGRELSFKLGVTSPRS